MSRLPHTSQYSTFVSCQVLGSSSQAIRLPSRIVLPHAGTEVSRLGVIDRAVSP